MLSDFLLDIYKGMVEFLAWVIIIAFAIVGLILGMGFGDSDMGILGLVIGIVVGFFVVALLIPPLLILFKIYDRLGTIGDSKQ